MPEYLAPGVYVEEVSFRAKTIEGVSTSVTGFVGPTRFGPVGNEPELLTSFADFERIYGGLDELVFDGTSTTNYVAHAVRAFFDNGGSKLYVTRIFEGIEAAATASRALGTGSPPALTLRARFPGQAGNMKITFALRASPNLLSGTGSSAQVRNVRAEDIVFITNGPPVGGGSPPLDGFYTVTGSGSNRSFVSESGTIPLNQLNESQHRVHLVTVLVRVQKPGLFDLEEELGEFAPHPNHRNALTAYFMEEQSSRLRHLMIPFWLDTAITSGTELLRVIFGTTIFEPLTRQVATDMELESPSPNLDRPRPSELERSFTLTGGSDGAQPTANTYKGRETGLRKTGLETFVDLEEISIVAAPGATASYADADQQRRSDQVVDALLTHCTQMRYRVAVLDAPGSQAVSEVRAFRSKFDSKYGALYYPWVKVVDPLDPAGVRELSLPPSGYVAGIYARNDAQQPGVSKAPANETVRGAIGFELLLNKAQQDILNPEGVNCFRFFEGRGYRLWGARTISSDPEWKYVNVRRYFAYVERSIDRGTQWVVFENNDNRLWANVRQTVEDFLYNEWRNGALFGATPEEAYFVRCDRSTMTQNDLDNGRLVCLIGIAPQRPAEFVIFRIGQFTADRRA